MSRSSHPGYGNYYGHTHRHPGAAPPARRLAPGAYTFGHAGRQIRFGPIAFWGIVGSLVIMAGSLRVAPTYLAFPEVGLARRIARPAPVPYASDVRIAALSTQARPAPSPPPLHPPA